MTGSGRMRRACACEVIAANALGQLTWISNVDELQRETQGNGGSRGFPAESADLGIRRVHEDRHVGQLRHRLLEELQAFPTELDVAGGEAGDIAAWTGEPRHQPHADGVGHAAEDDWHTAGLSQSLSERVHIRPVRRSARRRAPDGEITDPVHLPRRLRIDTGRRKKQTDRENDCEPDPAHGHLSCDGWPECSRRHFAPCGTATPRGEPSETEKEREARRRL